MHQGWESCVPASEYSSQDTLGFQSPNMLVILTNPDVHLPHENCAKEFRQARTPQIATFISGEYTTGTKREEATR